MSARGSLWLPLVVLLLLAGLSFWIERVVQAPAETRQTTQSSPEGIMENFEALRTTRRAIHNIVYQPNVSNTTPAPNALKWNLPILSS